VTLNTVDTYIVSNVQSEHLEMLHKFIDCHI